MFSVVYGSVEDLILKGVKLQENERIIFLTQSHLSLTTTAFPPCFFLSCLLSYLL